MSSIFSHLRRGFGENIRFAFLAVRAHKLRAFLTVLGNIVAVTSIITTRRSPSGASRRTQPRSSSAGFCSAAFQASSPINQWMQRLSPGCKRSPAARAPCWIPFPWMSATSAT